LKQIEMEVESPARTLLKSTLHVRLRETRGNYWRSVLVGLQFGIFHLPGELLSVVFFPLLRNLFCELFEAGTGTLFVFVSSVQAIMAGFMGLLEATDEPNLGEDE